MNAVPRRRGHRLLLLILPLLALCTRPAGAQGRGDLHALADKAKAGAADDVRALLPSLRSSHPDKAGVLFLDAMTQTDAEKAVELYQRIADEHRGSEWADDALYRLYQYSFAVGAYRTARTYTDRLATEHPKSPFLSREQGAAANGKAASPQTSSPARASAKEGDGASSASAKKPDGTKSGGGGETQGYAVQVGAFSRKADAEKLSSELRGKGYTAYIREKTVSGKTVQAVWLGMFTEFSQAQAFARKFKEQQKIDAIVVRR